MGKYVIDGRQLLGKIGGVQRFIYEIVLELDKIAEKDEIELLIPKGKILSLEFKNIKVVHYGKLDGLIWEQIDLPFYLIKNKKWGVFPCTIVPILYPKGIAVLHDIMIKTVPMIRKNLGIVSRTLLLINYRAASKHSIHIVTVSDFSKKEIISNYNISENKITVIGNAWQHINRVIEDKSIDKKFNNLKYKQFYFSLSANRIQKNFKWIYEIAKKNPNDIFAIAGTVEEWQKQNNYEAPNLIHLGYIEDSEVKALMKKCKAFLFPSIAEGFGIPPMEALAVGCPIIIAKSSCLPEIYGNSAHYIDPYDYDVDLNKLLSEQVDSPEDTLNKFGWDISAKKLLDLMHKIECLREC